MNRYNVHVRLAVLDHGWDPIPTAELEELCGRSGYVREGRMGIIVCYDDTVEAPNYVHAMSNVRAQLSTAMTRVFVEPWYMAKLDEATLEWRITPDA